MGLPIHRNTPTAQSPSKHDPTAHTRSAIRRQSAVRTRSTRHPDLVLNAIIEQPSPDSPHPDLGPIGLRQIWEDATSAQQSLHPTRSVPAISLDRATSSPNESDPDHPTYPTYRQDAQLGTPPRPHSRRRPDDNVHGYQVSRPSHSMPRLRRTNSTFHHGPSSLRLRGRSRQTRGPSHSEINGLGDRQRSWSPESDRDQWDTLLTTITPDPSLPSASSSFSAVPPPPPPAPPERYVPTYPRPFPSMSQDFSAYPPRSRSSDALSHIPSNTQVFEDRLREVRDRLTNHQENLRSDNNSGQRSSLRLAPLPPTYADTPVGLYRGLRVNYDLTDHGPPDHLEADDDGNCPFALPSATLASPSLSSDSEEVSSNASGPRLTTTYSAFDYSQILDPDTCPHEMDVTADPEHTMSEPERDRFRVQQAQRLVAFNETLLDFVGLSNYIDRYRLPLPQNIDFSLVLAHMDRFETMLSAVAERQREYLTDLGIASFVGRRPEEFLGAVARRTQSSNYESGPMTPIEPSLPAERGM